jgi:hypothetical protein
MSDAPTKWTNIGHLALEPSENGMWVLLTDYAALASRLAEVEAERDEALSRRDAWKARAEGHVEIVNAMRAKTAGKDSRTLGRALLGAAKMEAEARADRLAREVEEARRLVILFANCEDSGTRAKLREEFKVPALAALASEQGEG